MPLTVLEHPLAQDLLTDLRRKETEPNRYRILCHHITTLLVLEATRNLKTRNVTIETPLEEMQSAQLDQGLAAVPILRAGLGMLQPVLDLFEDVRVGYIGLERNHDTAIAHSYYAKLPDFTGKYVLVLDPMLATGGSASQAISFIKSHSPATVVMVSVLATPEGVSKLTTDHPEVQIVTAAVDRELNSKKYILPGLGDFGDRLYGTF